MKRITKDNRGIALITVIIGVMFCLLLTSTMLRVSLLGLQSRSVNNQTSDTFYNAETVIDSMAMNVQNLAAEAWAETNTQNYTSSQPYVERVYSLLTGGTFPTGNGPHTLSNSEKTQLKGILEGNIINGGELTGIGVIEKFNGTTGNLEGFTIKNIEVKYEDPKTGMISKVKTDLTVRAPLYKKNKTSSYSFLAGGGMTVNGPSSGDQDGSIRVYGKAYCGYLKGTDTWENGRTSIKRPDSDSKYNAAVGLRLSNDCNLFYHGDVEINGDVYIGNKCNLAFLGGNVTIHGSVFIDKTANLLIKKGCNFECRAIYVNQTFTNGNPDSTNISTGNLIDRTTGEETARKGTYSKSGIKTIEHLPFAKKDKVGGEGWDTDYDTTSSQIFYVTGFKDDPEQRDNAGKATRISVSGGQIPNSDVKFTFSHSAEPVKNVEKIKVKTGSQYTELDLTTSTAFGHSVDVKFLELVDVNYLLKVATWVTGGGGNANYPQKKVTSTSETAISESYKWNNDNDSVSDSKVNPTSLQGGAGQWQSMGGFNVEVMIGTEPNNVANSHPMFVVVKDDIDFNDQNKDTKIYGILIAPEVIMSRPREGTNSIIPLDQCADNNGNKVSQSAYESFIDNVGLGYMKSNDSSGTSEYVVGNLIMGGISSLYSSSSGGQQYSAHIEVNSNMNLVEFSNYEKK